MTHMGKESKKEWTYVYVGFPGNSVGKETTCSAPGLIPRSRRSPGRGNGDPFQYSCLGNTMDTGTWWATVHGVAESDMTERSCTHVLLQQGAVIFFIHFTVKTLHVGNLN